MNFTQPSASRGVTMARVNYNLEIENPDDWLAGHLAVICQDDGRGDASLHAATAARGPENDSRRHGENRDPGRDESGHRTFHVVSEPLTKRFFSFFQAVYCVQETSVHLMVLHGCRTLVDPIPSPLQPPDPPAALHYNTPCRRRN